MPYEVVKDHDDCPASEPYGVIKSDDGTLMGCHETRDDAEAQIAAIEADEEEEGLRMSKFNLPPGLHFSVDEPFREGGEEGAALPARVLVASGTRSRNRDYWTGKTLRLVPAGIRTEYWRSNGSIIPWMHNFNIPLAKGEIFLEDGQLWSHDNFEFHRMVIPIATQNWIGDAIGTFDTGVIADLWQQRYLNAVSIHIMCTPEDEENIVETDDEFIIPTSEMLEFSIVTMPGDREATREEMLSAGVSPPIARFLCKDGVCLPNHQGGPVPEGAEYILGAEGQQIFLPSKTGRIVPGAHRYWQLPEGNHEGISIEEIDGLWQLRTVSGDSSTANTYEQVAAGEGEGPCADCDDDSDSPASSGGSRKQTSVEDTMTKPFKSLGGNAAEAPAVDETTAVNDSPPAEAPAAVEEEVMEEEFVAEDYEELEPIELEFSAVEIAEAIAADSDALLIVAQAMFEDPRVRQYLTQQVAEQAQAVPQRISLKVASPRNNGAPQGQRGTIAQSVQQSRRSFSTVKRSGGRVPLPEERQEAKPSHTLTRMARNT